MSETKVILDVPKKDHHLIGLDENIINATIEDIKEFTKGKPITTTNIMLVIAHTMERIVLYTSLTGAQKKRIVLESLEMYVEQSDLNDTAKSASLWVLENVAPSTIDIIVDASKGRINITAVKKGCFPCFN